jgi:amino acid adenylation domain-containing protein
MTLLHELLERSAARDPRHQAVSFEGRSVTYAELDRQSNLLAGALIDAGVTPGDRVGILLEKSIEAVTAIFAALKAGAVYVPLDVNAPTARLTTIVDNCRPRALFASPRLRTLPDLLASARPIDVRVLTERPSFERGGNVLLWVEAMSRSPGRPAIARDDRDAAYILYTSGSTGQPKGVEISHRNALAFIDWACDAFALTPNDRVANHAPFHFDLSVFDIYATFKAGATLCPVPPITSRFPVELGRFIQDERISVWYSVPSALVLLLERGKLDALDLSALRAILFAGEVFATRHLHSLMERVPHARYCNLYGPTETNVVTWHEVTSPPDAGTSLPIGKPCSGAEVFAIDDAGDLVAKPGKRGELYVRGPTVALGYFGDAERTSQGFVADPRGPASAERVYRTGDIVSLDDDGNLLFHGRADAQVKLRGYRIELGDVETALLSHADVQEAAVRLVEGEDGGRLEAYVARRPESPLAAEDLRRHCSQLLPPYMIPEAVVFMEALPRTPNGKIDRVRLSSESSAEIGQEQLR